MATPNPFDSGRFLRGSARISLTVPAGVADLLHSLATSEGRSASNLAAYLLERALQDRRNSE
jgi:hypothetical protein